MPTYEYSCKTCGEHVEVVQSFKDEPLTECPACGGPLRKVFGNIGIAFKGSGFYKTDSRKAPAGSDSGPGSGSSSGGESGKSGKKSESTSTPVSNSGSGSSGSGSSASGSGSSTSTGAAAS
jgi:putative FmdB family regulatory protein